jgi:hypothetical protein
MIGMTRYNRAMPEATNYQCPTCEAALQSRAR